MVYFWKTSLVVVSCILLSVLGLAIISVTLLLPSFLPPLQKFGLKYLTITSSKGTTIHDDDNDDEILTLLHLLRLPFCQTPFRRFARLIFIS